MKLRRRWLAVVPSLATAATVKVGVVLTYSGTGAQLAQQIERGMELYLAREGTAKLGEHAIELIKRDDKNPGGDAAKVAVQELIVREDVDLLTGFIYSPNIIASAPLIEQAKVPTLIMNAATAWIGPVALSRPRLHEHVADRLSHGSLRRGKARLWDRRGRLYRLSPRQGFAGRVPDGLRAGGRSGGRRDSHGRAGEVPDFTPFMQRVKDARPDCFYVFVPAGNHVAAVFKTYAALGMKDAGIV